MSSVLLTQVEDLKDPESGLQDAQYFRTRAELYFALSRRMSIRSDAEYCRIIAERNLSRAIDLENDPTSMSSSTSDARSVEHG